MRPAIRRRVMAGERDPLPFIQYMSLGWKLMTMSLQTS
jgi:hypothetical protein